MAKEKARQVVRDISKASLQVPNAGGGVNLSGLRTNPTNKMMESLSGFSASIAKFAAIREKNNSAKEALKARNDALQGKYSTFDRESSVQVYDHTRGDIKGQTSSVLIQELLTASNTDILNQNLSLEDSLVAFDESKSNMMQDNFAEHLQQSESYRAGYLPHVVSTIEKNRVQLAAQHQAKFIAETKSTQSEFVTNMVASSPQTGPDKGINFAQFKSSQEAGINMGLTREESTLNTIDTIGLIAVTEGKPWLLKFADEVGKDGFKVNNNILLKKKIIEFRSKAQAQFIQIEKLRIANEERERVTGQRVTLQEAYKSILKDPSADHSGMIKDIGTLGTVDGPKMAALSTFAHNVRLGDREIAPDNKMEVHTKLLIARGEITKIEQLVKLYNESSLSKRGINKAAFDRLTTDLETQLASKGSINSFTTNRDSIKNIFGDDEFIEKNVGGYGITKLADAKEAQSFSIRAMDQSLIFFQSMNPEESLSGPKAGAFFFRVRVALERLLEQPKLKRQAQEELSKLKIGFLDNGDIDPASVKALEEDTAGFFSKEKIEVPEKIQKELKIDQNDGYISLLETYEDARARNRDYLQGSDEFIFMIRKFVNGEL